MHTSIQQGETGVAQAIDTSFNATDNEKSDVGSPSLSNAIVETGNANEERQYIVGWRLSLLTFR